MWTASDLEELSVWADDLQVLGDPWGELVTTSLAADASDDPEHRSQLEARVAELERDVLRPRVQPLLDGFDHIRPIWEHGVLVGLRVNAYLRANQPTYERVAELLRLPAARFLWLLRVTQPTPYKSSQALIDVPRLLLEPDIVARPRVVILGARILRNVLSQIPLEASRVAEDARRIAEPARGLLSLIIDRDRYVLPWGPRDDADRKQAFDQFDARIRIDPSRLSVADRTSLARALWDDSKEIRMAALDCLGVLGVEAAPLIPDLVWTERAKWEDRAVEVLAELAAQPEVVARVADNFLPEQVGALEWLQTIDELDARSIDRIAAMSDAREDLPNWLIDELVQKHRRVRPPPEPLPEPTLADRPTWLGRLRSWLTRSQ